MKQVKVTERGWMGHFPYSGEYYYTRNTLVEGENDSVVVSSIGNYRPRSVTKIEPLEKVVHTYYETVVFGAIAVGEYIEADFRDRRTVKGERQIVTDDPNKLPMDVDNLADKMHDNTVSEFVELLSEDKKL